MEIQDLQEISSSTTFHRPPEIVTILTYEVSDLAADRVLIVCGNRRTTKVRRQLGSRRELTVAD